MSFPSLKVILRFDFKFKYLINLESLVTLISFNKLRMFKNWVVEEPVEIIKPMRSVGKDARRSIQNLPIYNN